MRVGSVRRTRAEDRCGADAIVSSEATRGGYDRAITEASGATYRSLTHLSTSSIDGSKNRTGDTAFLTGSIRSGTSSEDPSTHPRTSRPWNDTWSSESTARSTQISTGPERIRSSVEGLVERAAELVGAVGRLPGELLAAEVTVGRRLLVDRPAEVELADDRGRPEVERVPHEADDPLRVDPLGAERVNGQRDGMGGADGVGHLELEPVGEARGHQVLGHVSGHVGG